MLRSLESYDFRPVRRACFVIPNEFGHATFKIMRLGPKAFHLKVHIITYSENA
jgi:hypothetical protein